MHQERANLVKFVAAAIVSFLSHGNRAHALFLDY